MTRSLQDEEAGTWPALLVAAESGDVDAAKAELAAGADVNQSDDDGWSALHLSALNAHASMVDVLVGHPGIDVNCRNRWKSTPLSLASAKGHHACILAIVRHPQTDINARAEYYGRTALIEAAKNGHLNVVSLLVEHGADVNATDKSGRNNALIEAIKGRHYAIAEYLLATGKLNFLNKDIRLNALIWAGNSHDQPFIERLETAIRKFFDGN
ncbi:ankyrin repeat domain-containing protein [Aminobacter anthyllidis]|uniref:ankyrin repeat domain-containing protein n=1 Tax=Aminobacter anthyllidis TaxID=1035067 RepID=UPI0024587021|nr:ankyrin repeat domain-containing protein [Aminobacter anthyllidis]MDH4988827.1 ankyrin repeat domain-containing protein [Aminobacter anthyllidis]